MPRTPWIAVSGAVYRPNCRRCDRWERILFDDWEREGILSTLAEAREGMGFLAMF